VASAGRVLVVSANMHMAFPPRPLNRVRCAAFANRVATILPSAPDAVLLQEVDRPHAFEIARRLTQRLSLRFSVRALPNDPVVDDSSEREDVVGDTAIVLNNTTMRVLEGPGVISTRYRADDRARQVKPKAKQHCWLAARQRGGPLRVAMVSVHFVRGDRLASATVGFCYKGQWAQKIARFLTGRHPGDLHVIAGDFNNRRCVTTTERVKCDTWPYWFALVEKWRYRDAVFSIHGQTNETLRKQYRKGDGFAKQRLDYIFTTGVVRDASHDTTYAADPADPGFYSDHRMLWAVIKSP
jgi:endonuclease/exonuclease/phosphatase family metal-dependent hydrolase